ncbi:thioredoxin family protein [Pararhodonellum marinum]|uniref:thioredoxin family protein n=1 Tax=Pararhodonellum marinum TaxID=2755358 RepID=UPI00188E5F9D|nr:thioredoxin fold domain-containing protein [Pararhodonellum marinum]
MKRSIGIVFLLWACSHLAMAQDKIQWLTFEEAAELNAENPKTILVDVYTDWCGWCKKMDKNTFTDPDVVSFVNEHFYAVKMNAENNQRKFKFKGREYTEATMARTMRVSSYPNFVIMDSKMENITQLPGYREAAPFLDALSSLYDNFTK